MSVDLLCGLRKHYEKAQQDYALFAPGFRWLTALCGTVSPGHESAAEVASKLWIVGRSMAAPLERTHDVRPERGNPYIVTADRLVDGTEIDDHLARLRMPRKRVYSDQHLQALYDAVTWLADIFHAGTGQYKVSLASKYLHIHEPSVPIYDDYSMKALRKLVPGRILGLPKPSLWVDDEYIYGRHLVRFERVHAVTSEHADEFGQPTAKTIDNFLLYWQQD